MIPIRPINLVNPITLSPTNPINPRSPKPAKDAKTVVEEAAKKILSKEPCLGGGALRGLGFRVSA